MVVLVVFAVGCRVGTVTHVVDGDTLDVNGVRVRVVGIDTPERGQCGYAEASARVAALLDDGRPVIVLPSAGKVEYDRYEREIAYVRRDDVDLGRVLIAEGLAHARYDSLDGYDRHPLQDEYRALDAATRNLCE